MRNLVLLSTVAALVSLTSFNAKATTQESDTGHTKVVIVEPVQVTHTGGKFLDFGTSMAAVNHTITVDQSNNCNVTSSEATQLVLPGDCDEFTVTGPQNTVIGVSITPATLQIDQKLNVTSFATDCGNSFTMPAAEEKVIKVGGTLAVTAGATAGTYDQGTYTLTVSY